MYFYAAILLILFTLQIPVEKNLTNHISEDRYASYSPDGSKILFESNRNGNWDLFVANVDGSFVRQMTRDSADDRRPSWHPSEDEIIFESNRSGEFQLYVLNLYNSKVRVVNLPQMSGEPMFASYSPDGQFIAYTQKSKGDSSKLLIVDPKGNQMVTLADYGYRSFYPRWSPDGGRLLFFSRHETANEDDEIYVIKKDGSGIKRLTNWPKHNFCPTWSPDGERIAFAQSMQDTRPEIFIMNKDGSDVVQITKNEGGDTLPTWSPDGKRLLITAYRNGNYEIIELIL